MSNKRIQDVMTKQLVTCAPNDTIGDAARKMRDNDIGDVLIVEGDHIRGVLTDRDIVVRVVADRRSLDTACSDVCTAQVATVRSDASIADAARIMREHAVRRLPVVDDGKPVGIVSLGDLAIERDPRSLLGSISAAPENSSGPVTAK